MEEDKEEDKSEEVERGESIGHMYKWWILNDHILKYSISLSSLSPSPLSISLSPSSPSLPSSSSSSSIRLLVYSSYL